MESLKAISSYFTWKSQGADNQSSSYSKFTKVAAGIGVAGLAVLSWKIVAAGALAYSAYRGGQYLHGRYFQRRVVKKEGEADAEAVHPQEPVSAGSEAHGDLQEERHREEPAKVKPKVAEERQPEKTDQEKEAEIIASLRKQQAQYPSRAIKNTFEILITHPNVGKKGGDIQWIKKMLLKHGPWSKRTFGMSLHVVKAFRKIKSCFPTKKKSENIN